MFPLPLPPALAAIPLRVYARIAAVAIFLALLAALWVQAERLDAAQAELQSAEMRRLSLIERLNRQNSAVSQLQAEALAARKRSDAAAGKALKGLAAAEARVRAMPAPPVECAAALDWAVGQVQGAGGQP
jgi:hypothetical protein